jgi:hypothetical protein
VLVDGRVRAPVQCMVCGAFVAAGPERLPDARPEVCEGV